jgi:hypothetical protein
MIDRKVPDGFEVSEPHVHRHAAPAILFQPQAAPRQDAGAGRAKQDFQRRVLLAGPTKARYRAGDIDPLAFEIISPKRAVAVT